MQASVRIEEVHSRTSLFFSRQDPPIVYVVWLKIQFSEDEKAALRSFGDISETEPFLFCGCHPLTEHLWKKIGNELNHRRLSFVAFQDGREISVRSTIEPTHALDVRREVESWLYSISQKLKEKIAYESELQRLRTQGIAGTTKYSF